MLAILRLYLIKGKKFPLLMSAIVTILLLWIMILKILVEPAEVIQGSFNLKTVNLGIFIFGMYFLVKRDSLAKGGFLLRLPVSDREIVAANIVAFWILSIAALLLSGITALTILYFFKIAGFQIAISWDKFNLSQITAFMYIAMYLGLFYAFTTFIQKRVNGQNAKKLVLLVLILMPIFLITALAVVLKTTSIEINDQTLTALWNHYPAMKSALSGMKQIAKALWKIRLIVGYALIFLLYRLRYLADA